MSLKISMKMHHEFIPFRPTRVEKVHHASAPLRPTRVEKI